MATLPALKDLKVNLANSEDAVAILTNLPNLRTLNGKSTKEESQVDPDIDENDIDVISLNNEIPNFDVRHKIFYLEHF